MTAPILSAALQAKELRGVTPTNQPLSEAGQHTSKVLEIIRTAAADCHAHGNDMARNELLEAASMVSDLLVALSNLVERVDISGGLGEYVSGPSFALSAAREAITKAEGTTP